MNMTYRHNSLKAFLVIAIIAAVTCCDNHSDELIQNIHIEFEETYRYVLENMSVGSDHSDQLALLKHRNNAAFTSIAYTWHSLALKACSLAVGNMQNSSQNSYERILRQTHNDNVLGVEINHTSRACLSKVYFDNWSKIQDMILLNFPNTQ